MTVTVDQTTEPVNLIWTAGDTSSQMFRFLTAPGQPMDLTSITVRSQARSTLGQTIPLVVTVEDPTAGVIVIYTPAEGLAPDVYQYDIEFDYGDGTVATWVKGHLQIRQGVTI